MKEESIAEEVDHKDNYSDEDEQQEPMVLELTDADCTTEIKETELAMPDKIKPKPKRIRYPCSYCTKDFTRPARVRLHIEKHHPIKGDPNKIEHIMVSGAVHRSGQKCHICDICGRLFNRPVRLRQHMEKFHPAQSDATNRTHSPPELSEENSSSSSSGG